MPFGEAGHEKISLNRDSLWTGGPFENVSYNGGNPVSPISQYLPDIRDWIWKNGTGNVTALMGDDNNYGSYAVLGNLSVVIDGVGEVAKYNRSLDLETAVHTTVFSVGRCTYMM